MITLLLATMLAQTHPYSASVVDCYDGDTCTVNFHLGLHQVAVSQKLRLCDVDAPEIRRTSTREDGIASRDALLAMIIKAKIIVIELAQKPECNRSAELDCDMKDSFGRWLGYLIVDGENLNEWLLDEGYAVEYAKRCIE